MPGVLGFYNGAHLSAAGLDVQLHRNVSTTATARPMRKPARPALPLD